MALGSNSQENLATVTGGEIAGRSVDNTAAAPTNSNILSKQKMIGGTSIA